MNPNHVQKTPTEPAADFDWDSIEPEADLSDTEMHKLKLALVRLFEWINKGHDSGATIRAHVVAWVILPAWAGRTQTEIAQRLGISKQAVGREAKQFSRLFKFKCPGMQKERKA